MSTERRIYLDHNATTPLDPEALQAMLPWFSGVPANPSAPHGFGEDARYALEKARRRIARLLGAPEPDSIRFTGGGTEAINLAIRGAAWARRRAGLGTHLVTSPVEHKAGLDTILSLVELHGFSSSIVEVDAWGRVDPESLIRSLRPDTVLVSIMLANNELGTVERDYPALARIVRERAPNALLHCDGVQAIGKVPITLPDLDCDLFSIAAHKFRGPLGIGALYVRPETKIEPIMTGGGQEGKLRPGTENVAGAVGMARALELALERLAAGENEALAERAEALWRAMSDEFGESVVRNSLSGADCLPGTLHLSIRGADSRPLLTELALKGFALSAGSACSSHGPSLSHVLRAVCPSDPERARGALRIGFGLATQAFEPGEFVASVQDSLATLAASRA